MQAIKLTIAQPCHEKWQDMTQVDRGRHCLSCNKTVVDFSKMSDAQVLKYFSEYSNQSTCGRLYNNQLNRPIYDNLQKSSFSKYFALTLGLGASTLYGQSHEVTTGIVLPYNKYKAEVLVKNTYGETVSFANITILSENLHFQTDDLGKVLIEFDSYHDSVHLVA